VQAGERTCASVYRRTAQRQFTDEALYFSPCVDWVITRELSEWIVPNDQVGREDTIGDLLRWDAEQRWCCARAQACTDCEKAIRAIDIRVTLTNANDVESMPLRVRGRIVVSIVDDVWRVVRDDTPCVEATISAVAVVDPEELDELGQLRRRSGDDEAVARPSGLIKCHHPIRPSRMSASRSSVFDTETAVNSQRPH
jgi:hypothetical protein